MQTTSTWPLMPFLEVLRSSLRNERWQQFKQVFRDGLSAIAGQTWNHVSSAFRMHGVGSPGSMPEPPPLFQLASAYWVSQAIYAAAKLNVADALKSGPKSVEEIARATNTDLDSVGRLMRALCVVGVFRTDTAGNFEITALGRPLQSHVPGSLRAMIISLGEVHYTAWAHLVQSVKSGAAAFPRAFGSRMFEYLGQEREAGDAFNLAMSDYSALSSCALLLSYDFSEVGTIMDVGGGHGKLLTKILRMYPGLSGILFDMPPVIEDARVRLMKEPCQERCLLVSGSFLESIPAGADAYLMSSVIHDWDDKHAVQILSNCRRSMKRDARLILIEIVLPAGEEVSFGNLLDLNMLVMNGGRERTEWQFRELFDAAGFKMARIVPTLSALSVLEAIPK